MRIALPFLALLLSSNHVLCQKIGITNLEEITFNIGEVNYTYENGNLNVYENHEDNSSRVISIPFKRIKTNAEAPLAPIFLFEGGPANNPSIQQQWDDLLPILTDFTLRSDLIVLEQRGNGNSIPNLQCPKNLELSTKKALDNKSFEKAFIDYIKSCEDHWISQGHHPSQYNVVSMSKDADFLRNELGYNKIMLFGGSFGSHWSLNYLKQFPNNVDRILLDSPEGFNHTAKLPSYAEQALSGLSELVAQDEELSKQIPDFKLLIKQVIQDLGTNKSVKTSDGNIVVTGSYELKVLTASDLGRSSYKELPYHYLNMSHGDFSWLADRALSLKKNLTFNLMSIISDCTSGVSEDRWKIINESAKGTLLGDAMNQVSFKACPTLQISPLGEEIRAEIQSSVPILIVSGTQDARTPPSNAKEILSHFDQGHLLTVKNASHDIFQETADRLFPILKNFLSTTDLHNYPKFQTMEYKVSLKKH